MRRFCCLVFLLVISWVTVPQTAVHATTQPVTVYLHGHNGNRHSMLALMAAAKRQKQATPALVMTVSAADQVTCYGQLTAHTPRPLVQVVFLDRHELDYHRLRRWLYNVLATLNSRYDVRQVNLVAHSLGNTAVLFYLLRWGRDAHLPQVAKWVSIAGNFDGIAGMHLQPQHNHLNANGRPHLLAPAFRQAMLWRDRFPAVAILNIYGNLADGSASDGRILNASSRALGFLVAGHAASYTERRFSGPAAQHSRLRENPQVATAANDFLWPASVRPN